MLEQQLAYLEKCSPPKNKFWQRYIEDRAPAIQSEIDRLRRFANRRPGKVADHCNALAGNAQMQLDAILSEAV